MVVLGLNAFHGDAAAVILVDGELVAAAEEERFERVKHWAGFPTKAVEYCLAAANARIEDVDHVAIGRDPRANLVDKFLYSARHLPSPSFVADRARNLLRVGRPRNELAAALGVDADRVRAKSHAVEHHRAHLASASFASPFDSAAVVSIDGFGDFASTTWGVGRDTQINPSRRIRFPHSLGLFYSGMAQYLGFPRFGDEYKVMGLAAYGEPDCLDALRQVVRVQRDGGFELGLEYFQHHTEGIAMTWVGEPRYERINSERLEDLLGPARQPGAAMEDRFRAVAASAQAVFEEAYLGILTAAAESNPGRRLCLAGGCALNGLANGKILRRERCDELFIQPAAYDAGTALGAALHVWHQTLRQPRRFRQTHSYFGPGFSQTEVEDLLQAEGVPYTTLADDVLLPRVAAAIRDGQVVGWFQGRMEWGPRALGNRSILVDPRRAEMKDILNQRIKRRESFPHLRRPSSSSVLATTSRSRIRTRSC